MSALYSPAFPLKLLQVLSFSTPMDFCDLSYPNLPSFEGACAWLALDSSSVHSISSNYCSALLSIMFIFLHFKCSQLPMSLQFTRRYWEQSSLFVSLLHFGKIQQRTGYHVNISFIISRRLIRSLGLNYIKSFQGCFSLSSIIFQIG